MPQKRSLLWSCVGAMLGFGTGLLGAQTPPPPEAAAQPTFTLRTESRLVIEDVLVTDAQGKPVHGLARSQFHLFDDNKPQIISSLEEPTPTIAAPTPMAAPLPPGYFSNAATLGSNRSVSEVLLIDADDLDEPTQMFLLAQAKHAVTQLPAGEQASVFRVSNGRPVQIRGMTTDRDDLQRALNECLPVLTHTIDSKFQSAVDQLLTISAFLEPIPGRKNVLWFAGPFPLVPVSDDEQSPSTTPDYAARQRTIHLLQEELAEARISVYPIDPRGVLTTGLAPPATALTPEHNRSMAGASGVGGGAPSLPLPNGYDNAERYGAMDQLADATGGRASHLNDLEQQITEDFNLGRSAYQLGYTPAAYNTDESWHTVHITVDGPYRLSYRRGYLATATGMEGARAGKLLQANGEIQNRTTAGNSLARKTLVFTVKLGHAGATNAQAHGNRVTVSFRIPASELTYQQTNGMRRDQLSVTSYAYDGQGKLRGGSQQELDSSLDDAHWQTAQTQQVSTEQTFDLPKEARYFFFVVREKNSRRVGTLMLPARVLAALP